MTGATDLRRASAREAHDLTGFAIGGIPPIGHLRPVRVIMDPDLGRYTVVWAAAGLSTAVFGVPPATLRILSNATVAPIAEDRPTSIARPTWRWRPAPDPDTAAVSDEPRNATVTYPGGLRARWRWGGSGPAPAVFALTEAGGSLIDLGPRSRPIPMPCAGRSSGSRDRAAPGRSGSRRSSTTTRVRCTGTAPGSWSSPTGSTPTASRPRPASARWDHRSASPIVALLGVAAAGARPGPVRGRDVRHRAGRDRGLAGGPLRGRRRCRPARRQAGADRLRRAGHRPRSGDGADRRLTVAGRAALWTDGG